MINDHKDITTSLWLAIALIAIIILLMIFAGIKVYIQ
jgi:hypothetical protein